MLSINIENLDEMAVIECRGRIVRSDTVYKLRDAVLQQTAPLIVLDMSEVTAIGGGGLGMLAFLERWARQHDVHLKLYCPSKVVLEGLAQNRSLLNFEVASFQEMTGILAHSDSRDSMAA